MSDISVALYHPDTTPKQPLTKDDLTFLTNLQTELNTQDTACTRDPRYWGLMQEIAIPASSETADAWHLMHEDSVIADNIEDAMKKLHELIPKTLASHDLSEETGLLEMTDLEFILDNRDISEENLDLQVIPVQFRHEVIQNAFFLTRKDAVAHLVANKHNYFTSNISNVYPYCMRADREPTYDRLVQILRQTDWSTLMPLLHE